MRRLRTKEELAIELKDLGFLTMFSGYEAYGKQGAFAYVRFESLEKRTEAETILRGKGYLVSSAYWPGGQTAEIRIRKFAGIKDW